jgi:NAD(P)-dependent dehydrogenase (short-subunit alcohol dehydrogenase family)
VTDPKPLRIFLTGGSSGIGASLRMRLIERGHHVFSCGKEGPDAHYDFTNVIGSYVVAKIWQKATEVLNGPIDILINNAGITRIDYIENQLLDDFQDVMNCNVKVPWMFSKEMVKQVAKEEKCRKHIGGAEVSITRRIISTSSMAASNPLRCSAPYCASKAALEMMMRAIAKETAQRFPLITCSISPSGIENTEMQKQVEAEMVSKRGFSPEGTPLGRKITHEELLKIFVWACEEMPEAMSGTVLHCSMGG